MNTTVRFEKAVKKLYTAFHNDQLNPECCQQCAVGNILDRADYWKNISDDHGSLQLNYVGLVNQKFGKRFNGYTPSELLQIEAAFLRGCGYSLPLHHKGFRPSDPQDKEVLFNGLCEVISCLCRLDGIDDVMDYSILFNFDPACKEDHLHNA